MCVDLKERKINREEANVKTIQHVRSEYEKKKNLFEESDLLVYSFFIRSVRPRVSLFASTIFTLGRLTMRIDHRAAHMRCIKFDVSNACEPLQTRPECARPMHALGIGCDYIVDCCFLFVSVSIETIDCHFAVVCVCVRAREGDTENENDSGWIFSKCVRCCATMAHGSDTAPRSECIFGFDQRKRKSITRTWPC